MDIIEEETITPESNLEFDPEYNPDSELCNYCLYSAGDPPNMCDLVDCPEKYCADCAHGETCNGCTFCKTCPECQQKEADIYL